MAIKSTIYKAALEVVDLDRHYYAEHRLTLARHPSETDERLMVRVLAFALNAHERLAFGKGISDSGEPDLWLRSLAGETEHWIELGHPDPRTLAKACKSAARVTVYTFSARPAVWWDDAKGALARFDNIAVWHVDHRSAAALAAMAAPAMGLQCSVQDGEVWMRDDRGGEVLVGLSPAPR